MNKKLILIIAGVLIGIIIVVAVVSSLGDGDKSATTPGDTSTTLAGAAGEGATEEPYVDESGNEVILADIIAMGGEAYDFSDGYAFVEEGDNNDSYYIINTAGTIVGHTNRYCSYSEFSNGLAITDGLRLTKNPATVIDYTGADIDLGLGEGVEPCLITTDGNILVSQIKQTVDGCSYSLGVVSRNGEWVCNMVELPFTEDPEELKFYYEDLGENICKMEIVYQAHLSVYQYTKEEYLFNAENGNYLSIYDENARESTISNFADGKAVLCMGEDGDDYYYRLMSVSKSDFSKTDLGITAKKAKIERQEGEEVFYYEDSARDYGEPTRKGYYDTDFNLIIDVTDIENATFGEYYNGYAAASIYNGTGGEFLAIYDKSGSYAFDPIEIEDTNLEFGDGLIGYEKPDGNIEYVDTTGKVCVSFDCSRSDVELRVFNSGLVTEGNNYFDVNGAVKF